MAKKKFVFFNFAAGAGLFLVMFLISLAEAKEIKGSPAVSTMYKMFEYVTDLSTVRITFHGPVTGVLAENLTVNGSHATKVSKNVESNGEESYTFSGFDKPKLGEVSIVLSPGNIKVTRPAIPFEGLEFTKVLLDPQADEDGDGLTNQQEIDRLLSPVSQDTDQDGLPDAFEVHSACLNPLVNQAHPMDYGGAPLPGDDDADHDGLTDLQEFEQNKNPCLPDK